ncbi:MAG: ROK family glucokinase [Eubacterium sp.]
MKRFCFGVDVGGTTIKIGFFTTDGNLIEKCEIPTDKTENGSNILKDITGSIDECLKRCRVDLEDVEGVGIGLPGPVTGDGMILNCVNLGWGTFNIEKRASNAFHGLPVWAANDANAAALGEAWQGGGRDYEDMVMITLGTGVGGGVIIGGRIISGSNGAAGEIGHMPVRYDETEYCSCGKKGCLEQVASATGIVKEAVKILASYDGSSLLNDIDNFTAKDVFECAKQGDQAALDTIEIMTDYLSTAMAQVASVVNPEVFVLGGGVSRAGEFLINKLQKKFLERTFLPCRNAKIVPASLGNDAGIYGCAALVAKKL